MDIEVLRKHYQEQNQIVFTRMIQEKNCIGFFSIRRPWNIQGWGNSVYKRQFPYVKEENNEQ